MFSCFILFFITASALRHPPPLFLLSPRPSPLGTRSVFSVVKGLFLGLPPFFPWLVCFAS